MNMNGQKKERKRQKQNQEQFHLMYVISRAESNDKYSKKNDELDQKIFAFER